MEAYEIYVVDLLLSSMLFSLVVFVPPLWMICKKAGLNTSWAFLAVIPPISVFALVVIGIIAYKEWPEKGGYY